MTFDTVVTRGRVLAGSFMGIVFAVALYMIARSSYCDTSHFCVDFFESTLYGLIFNILIFTPLVFMFSLANYCLKGEVFRTWIRFSLIWIPLAIIIPFFASSDNANFGPSTSAGLALALMTLYPIISILIIITQSIRAPGSKK